MATRQELIDERAILVIQLAAVNERILAILGRNNKKYTYSNNETIHTAETHSLDELSAMKKTIVDEISRIDDKLNCGRVFVQLKNC